MRHPDDKKCSHGISFNDSCIYCEKYGLKEKIEWMKPIVERSEKRLIEINKELANNKQA
jgi:hypothetical protein